jgi:hypothetical protein
LGRCHRSFVHVRDIHPLSKKYNPALLESIYGHIEKSKLYYNQALNLLVDLAIHKKYNVFPTIAIVLNEISLLNFQGDNISREKHLVLSLRFCGYRFSSCNNEEEDARVIQRLEIFKDISSQMEKFLLIITLS